jgi:multiple sugar transport system substrate-binding protein
MRNSLLLALVVLLTGCSHQKQEDRTKLSFWHFWTSPDVKPTVESLVAEYERINPDIDIDLVDLTWSEGHEKIVVAFGANASPDVVELGSDWIAEFAKKGVLADLTAYFDSAGHLLTMWEPATIDGRVFAVPWLLGTRALFVNLDLLSKAGISEDRAPANWSELLEWTRRITALGPPDYGFGSNSPERHRLYKKFLPFLWSNGGEVISFDGFSCLLDQPQAIEALEFYTALSDAGLMETQQALDDRFLAGELGFVMTGDWLLRRIANQPPPFRIAASTIPPPISGGQSISFAGGEYLAISARSPHVSEALRFVDFLVSADADLRFARAAGSPTPSNSAAADSMLKSADSLEAAFLTQIRTARTSPPHERWVYIEEALERAVEEAILHKSSPEAALRKATTEIDEILKR